MKNKSSNSGVWVAAVVAVMIIASIYLLWPSLSPSSASGRVVSVKFTRPLSLGTDGDIHHLHLSEVQVFSKDGSPLPLSCAEPCVNAMGPEEGNGPEMAFDGDVETTYHNKWVGQRDEANPFYGTETHFLHLRIGGVEGAGEVGRIVVHHSHPQKRRVVGVTVELLENGVPVWRDLFSDEQDEYAFDVVV